jgi:thiol-disulfide isomerase/thioredoxin
VKIEIMKVNRLVLVAFLALAAVGALGAEPSGQPPLAGEMRKFNVLPTPRPAPEIGFTDLQGTPLQLADFRGKLVLVNLWATWCGPCVEEMPSLDRLQASLKGRDFVVLALSSDRGGARVVEPFLKDHGIANLHIYLDPKSIATRGLGVRGLPTNILIDRDGKEVGRIEGSATWDSAEASALIRWYLDRGGKPDDGGIVKTSG